MSQVAVLIPTRLKSSRLPNKPLAMINGKPLLQHVYEHALKVHPKEDIYIAAGDQEIVDLAHSFGAQAVLTDPALPSGTDRIVAAMKQIDPTETRYDTVVNFQGDGINVNPALNLRLVELLDQTGADWMTVGKKITDPEDIQNPAMVKIAMGLREGEDCGRALYFSRSTIPFNSEESACTPAYWHIGIYVYRLKALKAFVAAQEGVLEKTEKLEQLRALENGMKIYALIVPSVKLIEGAPADINTPEELESAQKFMF